MNITDFIGVFPNAVDDRTCDLLVQLYDDTEKLNMSSTRQQLEGSKPINKESGLIFPSNRHWIPDSVFFESIQPNVKSFIDSFWMCYGSYAEKYGILQSISQHAFYDSIKIQKTEPTGGYHIWHCEHDNRLHGSRLLLAMLYLNDVEEGGETEFLYQSRRIAPEKGTLVICPSGFTHTHRGNPPLKGNKYMINGWIEFQQ